MYKAKSNYIHRKIAGNDVLITVGRNIANFNGYIELNSTASLIWDTLKSGATKEELVQLLMNTYNIDEKTASKDVDEYLGQLSEHEMVEEIHE